MNNALAYVVQTIFDVVCFLFIARLLLQACRADFYNPISQGIVKATDPFLRPLRLVIPGFRNFDTSAFVAAWVFEIIGLMLVLAVKSQYLPGAVPLIAVGLYQLLRLVLSIYFFAIIIVIVLSFIAPGTYHPAAVLLHQVTEPVLAPARRLIPPLGGLDLSPIVVFMVLNVVRDYLLPAIFSTIIR
jgi:YggT family protein